MIESPQPQKKAIAEKLETFRDEAIIKTLLKFE